MMPFGGFTGNADILFSAKKYDLWECRCLKFVRLWFTVSGPLSFSVGNLKFY